MVNQLVCQTGEVPINTMFDEKYENIMSDGLYQFGAFV